LKSLAADGKIGLHTANLYSLNGESGKLHSVTLRSGDGEQYEVDCDVLLPFYGLTMRLGPVAEFGINLHENLVPVDTEKFETDKQGIFAIGDICWYPGKLKLILSGFHEGALMAQSAFRYVYPERRYRFQYTTSSTELHKKLGVDERGRCIE
jgi:thioredoxin reductase (NADPH)